jgi:hypothetical protein
MVTRIGFFLCKLEMQIPFVYLLLQLGHPVSNCIKLRNMLKIWKPLHFGNLACYWETCPLDLTY